MLGTVTPDPAHPVFKDELIKQLTVVQRMTYHKELAICDLVDNVYRSDLDVLIVTEFLNNTLTISYMDENGNGEVRRLRHFGKAVSDARKLYKKGYIPYHCIYNEKSNKFYFLVTDDNYKTDDEFFCQIHGTARMIGMIENIASLVWFDENDEFVLDNKDVDVHDGVFYVVEDFPDLRKKDGITVMTKHKATLKGSSPYYPTHLEDYDYGEVFTTGDPEYDRLLEAIKTKFD